MTALAGFTQIHHFGMQDLRNNYARFRSARAAEIGSPSAGIPGVRGDCQLGSGRRSYATKDKHD